jgi:alkylhydroperoxidase family enzyme
VFVLGLALLIAYSTLNGPRFRVNVCMSYGGRSACKTVHARSEAAALRAATENACADISSGVTDTMRCQQAEPQSVRWLERPR